LIQLHEFSKIELWLLKELNLSYNARGVLKREDFAGAFFMNLFTNFFFNEELDEILEGRLLDLREHNLHHLLSDKFLMGSFGVSSSLHLSGGLVSESNGEHSDNVTILGFSLDEGLNERMPLLDHCAASVSGNIHTVEVGVAIVSLDLVNLESDLSLMLSLFFWVTVR